MAVYFSFDINKFSNWKVTPIVIIVKISIFMINKKKSNYIFNFRIKLELFLTFTL